MDKWEYKIFKPGDYDDLEAKFNELGRQGWELICVLPGEFYFKRKINP